MYLFGFLPLVARARLGRIFGHFGAALALPFTAALSCAYSLLQAVTRPQSAGLDKSDIIKTFSTFFAIFWFWLIPCVNCWSFVSSVLLLLYNKKV